jgi:hypothetical protein
VIYSPCLEGSSRGTAMSPAYVRTARSDDALIISFTSIGEQPRVQLVRDGEEGAQLLTQFLSERPALKAGDRMRCDRPRDPLEIVDPNYLMVL